MGKRGSTFARMTAKGCKQTAVLKNIESTIGLLAAYTSNRYGFALNEQRVISKRPRKNRTHYQ